MKTNSVISFTETKRMRIVLLFLSSLNTMCSYKLDFTIMHGAFLNAERSQYYDEIQLQLCMKECHKRMNCSSINFDKKILQCNLSTFHHLDGVTKLSYNLDRIYAVIESRGHQCAACSPHDSCIILSTGSHVCIATECSNSRPNITKLMEFTFDPPFLRFNYTSFQTSGTTIQTSSCVPGKPWTITMKECDSPESILPYGNVTMSTIHIDHVYYAQYKLDSDVSWSSNGNTPNEWIQVVLPSMYNVTAVMTKGRADYGQWVKSYYVLYLNERTSKWTQLQQVFNGNVDKDTLVTNTFVGGILTKGIRLQPKTWHDYISLRFDVIGC